jgi:outer membrane protein assembly factor BamB
VPDFDKSSLSLRTALHYDATVEMPLVKLVELYRTAGRTAELLALYTGHLAQYPDDASARLVLARLYVVLKDPKAGPFLEEAVARHPEDAPLIWQQGQFLAGQRDPKAVEFMARAVDLEKSAARRAQWYGVLMKSAGAQGREDLVLAATRRLIEEGAMTAEQQLRWARQAMGEKRVKTASLLMEKVKPAALGTDNRVEAVMLNAEVLAASGKGEEAGKILDDLLEKLAPEYWRRREILMLRLDVTGTQGRDVLVHAARDRWQQPGGRTVSHALSLADVLEAAHRSKEALQVLQEAAAALPDQPQVEQRLMDLWESEGVDAASLAWMDALLKKHPGREDLSLRRVRWLFAHNQGEAAHAAFQALAEPAGLAAWVARGVEMARWLRRRNQLPDAAALLEHTLAQAPSRWDLRRELAEIYFVQRRQDEIAALFTGDWSQQLAPDARLEICQFLMNKQLWLEACRLLEPWLAGQPGAFDAHLLMARIHSRLADDAAVATSLEAARALCDTEARYQAWLAGLMQHATAREMEEITLRQEADRLAPGGGAPDGEPGITRWLAVVEQATGAGLETFAESLLTRALATGTGAGTPPLPAGRALALERLRLEILSSDPARSVETEEGLRRLVETDPGRAEDYRLRLALLYHKAGRQDLVQPLLEAVDPARATEPDTLRSAVPVALERGNAAAALAMAARLTVLQPGEPGHWVQWTSLLAQTGQEDQLRLAIREVLARAHDWNLKDETREELQNHLVASQWRSVLIALNTPGLPDWAAARREAANLEKLDLFPLQRHWMEWLLAYFSTRLGDPKAAADAMAGLARLDGKEWIPFPDGLELSAAAARESLEEGTMVPGPGAIEETSFPACLPPFTMGWGFSLEEGTLLTRVEAAPAAGLVLLLDDRHQLFAVDLRTGKLRWRTSPAMAAWQAQNRVASAAAPLSGSGSGSGLVVRRASKISLVQPSSGSHSLRISGVRSRQPELRMPLEFAVAGDRLYLLDGDMLDCLDVATGELRWRSRLHEAAATFTSSPAVSRLAADTTHVVVWQPQSSTVSSLNPATGKLTWQTQVPAPPVPAAGAHNSWGGFDGYLQLKSGVQIENGRVLVYSQTAALLTARDGRVLWRLGVGDLPGFPFQFQMAGEEGGLMMGAGAASGGPGPVASPQLIMSPGYSPVVAGSSYANGGVLFLPHRAVAAGGRWAFGTGLRTLLQGHSYYAPMARLHQGRVWALSGNGPGLVTALGMPLGQLSHTGQVIGIAAGQVVSLNGTIFTTSRPGASGWSTLMGVGPAGPGAPVGEEMDPSGALSGSRAYLSAGTRLRGVELRSGTALFDVPLPPAATAWLRVLNTTVPGPVATLPVGRPGSQQRAQQRRNYLPVGVLHQDDRGGGVLTGNTALVTDGCWIVPLNESAVVCLRGAGGKASAAPLSSPGPPTAAPTASTAAP